MNSAEYATAVIFMVLSFISIFFAIAIFRDKRRRRIIRDTSIAFESIEREMPPTLPKPEPLPEPEPLHEQTNSQTVVVVEGTGLSQYGTFTYTETTTRLPYRSEHGNQFIDFSTPGPDEVTWALDCETTGLHSTDRIVTFGAIKYIGTKPVDKLIYLIFDPCKKSHPEAEKVHGWDDWILRHQHPFWEIAEDLAAILMNADRLVAHNIEFDIAFLEREMQIAAVEFIPPKLVCTMQMLQEIEGGRRQSLNKAIQRRGFSRTSDKHLALEDANFAAALWLDLLDIEYRISPFDPNIEPSNLLPVPPRPETLPRRKNRKPPSLAAKGVPD